MIHLNRRFAIFFVIAIILIVTLLMFYLFIDSPQSKNIPGREQDVPLAVIDTNRNNNVSVVVSSGSYSFQIKEANALSCGSVAISWQAISEPGVEYDIIRAERQLGSSRIISVISQDDLTLCGESFCSYTDKTVVPRSQYFYTIRARGSGWLSMNNTRGCDSKQSTSCPVEVLTPVCEMGSVRIDNDVCTSVNLSWKPLLETASYRVYRATGENSNPILISEITSPQFGDSNIVADQEYSYAIVPFYSWGEEGKRSEIISVKTFCPDRTWEER